MICEKPDAACRSVHPQYAAGPTNNLQIVRAGAVPASFPPATIDVHPGDFGN